MTDRIFVEWFDPERPKWGGYVSSLDSDFQAALLDFVARCGPPTKVEFRAADEGWVKGKPSDGYCDACQVDDHGVCGGDAGLDPDCDCCVDTVSNMDPRSQAEHGTWASIDSWAQG